MVTGAGPGAGARALHLATVSGWRRFVADTPAAPQLLPGPEWTGLDEDKRAAYDDDRIAHHSRLLVVQTSAVRRSSPRDGGWPS